MARKGDQARQDVMMKILSTFAGSFISDKKVYVTAVEGGEPIQFAITLTMPKVPVASSSGEVSVANHDWSDTSATVNIPVEISAEDDAKVNALMERLGIKD